MKIVIFPMVHLAEERFYRAVQDKLAGCDIVVAEGVQGPSASTDALTRSYRLLRHKRSLGLAVQDVEYAALDARIVQPDLTGSEVDAQWHRIPTSQRLLVKAMIPFYVIWMLCIGTRKVLARHLATDDLPSPSEQALQEAAEESFGAVSRLLTDTREQALLHALQAIYDQHHTEDITVAVVYGAGHVVSIVRELNARFGYIASSGDWLDVFSL